MKRVGAIACMLAIVAMPVSALADSGVAYDSVNRIVLNADPATLQPGSFDQDYATASAGQAKPAGGGLFGKFRQAIAMGENAGAMLTQRHGPTALHRGIEIAYRYDGVRHSVHHRLCGTNDHRLESERQNVSRGIDGSSERRNQ